MEIPKIVVEHIKDGQAILFLGSGASLGAIHPKGLNIPIGQDLAKLIANKFLDNSFSGLPLSHVAELSISESNLLSVQEFIASIFNDFTPAKFHKLIPTFVWRAIVTTNYDLLVERAYDCVNDKLQTPVVFKKHGERVEEKLSSQHSLLYLKLHGCITDINDKNTPLILTPEQYITHKKGRKRLFERFESLACEFPVFFVGHSLGDIDIRAILLELEELGDAKPRSYIIAPNITAIEKSFWEGKKITCIQMTFENFLNQIDLAIPKDFRSLSILTREVEHPIVNRFKVSTEVKPSDSLMTFLSRDVDYIHKGYKTSEVDPKAFYKGYFVDLSPIIFNLDVARYLSDNIMSEIFLVTEEEKSELVEFYVIKGHAGSGKTVILKRLSWDASIEYDKLCLFFKSYSYIDFEPIVELFRLCNERIYLFIDSVSDNSEVIETFIERARKEKIPLTIVGAERHNEWNIYCERLEAYLTDSYEVKYLGSKEIDGLIGLLDKYKSLGYLEGKTFDEQKKALSKRAGRQLLVALHEATSGKPFTDIVYDEYNSIGSNRAKSLYLTVCMLHRLGIDTRAGLISRVHGIPFNQFKEELFDPLEYIVFAEENKIIKDYVYKSRHPHVAQIVFERVLTTPQDRYDEYVRIINSLDIDYASDWEALKKTINAKQLITLFPDPQMIRDIFSAANKRFNNNSMSLQQEAIFEMLSPGGSLDKAEKLLQQANKIATYHMQKKYIAHSLSEVAYKRAEKAKTQLEKNKYRQESKTIAFELAAYDITSEHPLHTILKIGLDELSETIDEGDELSIQRKIKEVEQGVEKAVQLFPEDSFILSDEARFSEMMGKHPGAIESLEKAFHSNKRSAYLAVRLAKMYDDSGDINKAVNILKECVEATPSDKYANYKLAMFLIKQSIAGNDEIKHHLRRSFTEGDTKYNAQFWYARILYLEGEIPEAQKIFHNLSEANVHPKIKRAARGIVKEDGMIKKYTGTISRMESSYGFIIKDGLNDRVFSYFRDTDKHIWEELTPSKRVSFQLAFNYRGPIAINIEKERNG